MLSNNNDWLYRRAAKLNNGMNISWLEQTWNANILNDEIEADDFVLLKKLGFASIRLPVAFTYFEEKGIPVEQVFQRIDKVLKLCKRYNFTLIVDYHYGSLKNDN